MVQLRHKSVYFAFNRRSWKREKRVCVVYSPYSLNSCQTLNTEFERFPYLTILSKIWHIETIVVVIEVNKPPPLHNAQPLSQNIKQVPPSHKHSPLSSLTFQIAEIQGRPVFIASLFITFHASTTRESVQENDKYLPYPLPLLPHFLSGRDTRKTCFYCLFSYNFSCFNFKGISTGDW